MNLHLNYLDEKKHFVWHFLGYRIFQNFRIFGCIFQNFIGNRYSPPFYTDIKISLHSHHLF